MTNDSSSALGGYFELELPCRTGNLDDAIRLNSARSALKLILATVKPNKIWLPAFSCDAILEAAQALSIAFECYDLSPSFEVDPAVTLASNELILLIDYFGVNRLAVENGIQRFGAEQTIVDCSQAFFAPATQALATFWSPRKFFGLPDGGLLHTTNVAINAPEKQDDSSFTRMSHLVSRLSESPEAGYESYLEAESSIAEMRVLRMSVLTERLLQSVDCTKAKSARLANFAYLHRHLGDANRLNLKLDNAQVPLCYPFLPSKAVTSRSTLLEQRIFLPCYWPEVLERTRTDSFEADLVSNGLFLPCDQRYDEKDMDRLVAALGLP